MTNETSAPKIFIITGPSGVGKDTVMRELAKFDLPLQRVVTTTSRPMRPGESEGKPYHFVTDTQFEQMVTENKFAEYAKVFNSWKGITRDELEHVTSGNLGVLLQLDHQGARTIVSEYPLAVVIVITPPSIEVLNQRLTGRGDKQAAELAKRLELNVHWQENFAEFPNHVVNKHNQSAQAAAQVAEIIRQQLEGNRA